MGMLCSLMRRFMQLMLGAEAAKLFEEVVPAMADMLLKLLSLLESHYQGADDLLGGEKYSAGTGLRLLGSQEVGILFLSQKVLPLTIILCVCLIPRSTFGANL